MPTWRCPHCGTPQAESSRCWVCRRSSTSCATCRHFRHSVAGTIGYCGLDPRRSPLRGDEIRGCWEEASEVPVATVERGGQSSSAHRTDVRRPLEFVAVGDAVPAPEVVEMAPSPSRPGSTREPGYGLWPDAEP